MPLGPPRRVVGYHRVHYNRTSLLLVLLLQVLLLFSHHSVQSSHAFPAASPNNKKKTNNNKRNKVVAVNRLAFRNYEILDRLEAGMALKGTEVKAVRDAKMQLRDGYVQCKNGQCQLLNVHIGKHSMSGPYFQHDERRIRDLLLHKSQVRKLQQQTVATGMTIVPLQAYFNDNNILKLEIALCRGKNVRDKRATIQAREAKREENRIIKNFRL